MAAPAQYRDPREARAQGILLIHQEISLVPEMSVAENIFLGSLPTWPGGFVRRRAMRQRVRQILDAAGGEFRKLDPNAKVSSLTFLPISRWSRSPAPRPSTAPS